MAATVIWEISTAASATWSTVTQIRFKKANNNTIDLNNPLVKPGAGNDYSFEKCLRVNVTVAPSNQLSNGELYTNGTFPTGVEMAYKWRTLASYAQPVQMDGTVWGTYTALAGNTAYAWNNFGTPTGTGAPGDNVLLGARIGTSVSAGVLVSPSTNFQLRYNEI
jgi:hypothetical protein